MSDSTPPVAPGLEQHKLADLKAPPSFWNSSPEARALRCNGAGAKGGIAVPNTFWGLSCLEAFDIHDWMYAEGGSNEPARQTADIYMLVNCQLLIERRTTGTWLLGKFMRWLRGVRANTYYNAVRDFGASAFSFNT